MVDDEGAGDAFFFYGHFPYGTSAPAGQTSKARHRPPEGGEVTIYK